MARAACRDQDPDRALVTSRALLDALHWPDTGDRFDTLRVEAKEVHAHAQYMKGDYVAATRSWAELALHLHERPSPGSAAMIRSAAGNVMASWMQTSDGESADHLPTVLEMLRAVARSDQTFRCRVDLIAHLAA